MYYSVQQKTPYSVCKKEDSKMYRVIKLGCVLPENQKKLNRITQKNFLDDIINALDGFEPNSHRIAFDG